MTLSKNILFILALYILFLGCSKKSDVTYPREQTLYIGGFQWGEPASFNPLSDWPVTWPSTGGSKLLYETLFSYNMLTGELEPSLAAQYELEDTVLSVFMREGTRWNDSSALTAEDVLYTFYLHKRYQTLHHSVWRFIDTISIDDNNTKLTFYLDRNNLNPLTIKDMIASVYILPKHVFSKLESDAKSKHSSLQSNSDGSYETAVLETMLSNTFISSTIGSGPYTLKEASEDRIVLERVESYWGNDILFSGESPAPKYVIHPLWDSNEDYNNALEAGELDVSATYCPMVWNKKKNGVGTWESAEPYYIPGAITSLLINLSAQKDSTLSINGKELVSTKNELLKPEFRRAVASVIDYEMIRKKAIQGYAPPLSPGYIINDGVEKFFYNDSMANALGAFTAETYKDLKTRQNLVKMQLADEGYTWIEDERNPGGRLVTPDGKVLADLTITSPKGWTDWEKAVKIAATSMRNIGVPVWEEYVEEDNYWSQLGMGLFDFIVKVPQAEQLPSLPWSRFEKVMSSEDIDTVGVYIYANEGRYKNPVADSLLEVIPRLKSDEEIAEGYGKLNALFMTDMPVIPLMYRPAEYYQFSEKQWRNFPTLDNPYAPPTCLNVAAGTKALWRIKQVTQ